MQRYLDVARITGTRGLDGYVSVHAQASYNVLFEAIAEGRISGLSVYFVPPRIDAIRMARIDEANVLRDGTYALSFVDVAHIDMVSALVGCHCLMAASDVENALVDADAIDSDSADDLPSSLISRLYTDELVGWHLIDITSGVRSVVKALSCPAGQTLLEVVITHDADEGTDPPDGGDTFLVPLAGDLICTVDETAHLIEMDLPKGLFDL